MLRATSGSVQESECNDKWSLKCFEGDLRCKGEGVQRVALLE